MKTIDWQVSNLELSKQLKELGVKQDSLWYFKENSQEFSTRYSAFTVAELGKYFKNINRDWLERKLSLSDIGWEEWEKERNKIVMNINFLAKILIYLLENKLIEIEK